MQASGLPLRDCRADRELGPVDANVEHVRDVAKQRGGGGVVARDEGGDLRDAGRAGVRDQLRGEGGADAALLVLVGDREGDLGAVAVANESCDRDRLRVTFDVLVPSRLSLQCRTQVPRPRRDLFQVGVLDLRRDARSGHYVADALFGFVSQAARALRPAVAKPRLETEEACWRTG